jgi:hypothetical protein
LTINTNTEFIQAYNFLPKNRIYSALLKAAQLCGKWEADEIITLRGGPLKTQRVLLLVRRNLHIRDKTQLGLHYTICLPNIFVSGWLPNYGP